MEIKLPERSLLRSLLTSVQHSNGVPEPSTPVPMDIHEGSTDEDSSDDSDDTVLVVSRPTGTWLVSQVSGPREELPEPVQVQQQ